MPLKKLCSVGAISPLTLMVHVRTCRASRKKTALGHTSFHTPPQLCLRSAAIYLKTQPNPTRKGLTRTLLLFLCLLFCFSTETINSLAQSPSPLALAIKPLDTQKVLLSWTNPG